MMRVRVLALVTAVTMLVCMAASDALAATSHYPVSWSVAHAAADFGTNRALDGANDWSCKPSAEHPDPVVLVHGLIVNQVFNWDTISPLLANNGFCVFALTYGLDPGESYFGGLSDMATSSQQLGSFVHKVLAATGARKVDLIGHSEGTVMPRYWMEFDGGAKLVRRFVMLAPLWNGTAAPVGDLEQIADQFAPTFVSASNGLFGELTTCGSCFELVKGSPFMNHLNTKTALRGVTYTDIVTRYDELAEPYTTGILNAPGVTNIVLQNQCSQDFSEHIALAFDSNAEQDMLNALDPAHAKPLTCAMVLPALGTVNPPSTIGLAN